MGDDVSRQPLKLMAALARFVPSPNAFDSNQLGPFLQASSPNWCEFTNRLTANDLSLVVFAPAKLRKNDRATPDRDAREPALCCTSGLQHDVA